MKLEELQEMKLLELREIAKELEITQINSYKKSSLIQKIIEKRVQDKNKNQNDKSSDEKLKKQELKKEDLVEGVLETSDQGFGFLRFDNFQTSDDDVYVSHSQIKRFKLKTGDKVKGYARQAKEKEKFKALYYIEAVNQENPSKSISRINFDELTPIYPNRKMSLETELNDISGRMIDLISPIGFGQRALIVAPPKAGKTMLLQKIAKNIRNAHKDVELIVLLIDERPEEVTEMKRSIDTDVIYSTFDDLPENHIKVAEIVLERAKSLVEMNKDVVILLDSITRLSRAYNLTSTNTGRTLSGGLDPSALHRPKRFFGAARNTVEMGSLTILATALVDTGSRMDDVIFEEFKGTGNMELQLSRYLSERRIFPAIDIAKSGTRREELLLTADELDALLEIRNILSEKSSVQITENLIKSLKNEKKNSDFISKFIKRKK